MSDPKFLIVLPFDWEEEKYEEFAEKIKSTIPHPRTSIYKISKYVWGVSVERGLSYTVAKDLGIGEEYSGFVFPLTFFSGRYETSFLEWWNG